MPSRVKALHIDFPDEIKELANNFRRYRLEKERNARKQKLEREKQEKRARAERLKNGLPYAKKIFNWAKAFSKSSVGKELMIRSRIPTVYRNIFFFDGHIDGTEWFRLMISGNYLRIDTCGRWNALSREVVKSPSDLATLIDTKIIIAACEWIDNGKVWKCIKCHLII